METDDPHVQKQVPKVEQPHSSKRVSTSTDLQSSKRTRNVVSNVNTRGVHLCATEIVGERFETSIKDVWSCLMDYDDVFRIGIHGTGGVGKTEVAKNINNKLLQNPNKFHHVFWVNVSPDWSIWNRATVSPSCRVRDLQSSISKAVGIDLPYGDDETTRAEKLSKGLAEKMKSVLILDDVWDYIPLQDVGIPVGVDRCTVVFTTRSLEVCRQLGCQRKIEIRRLPPDESYELFKKNLGKETTLSREVEEISRLVADTCVGLPLAITIVTRNMRGVTDIRQWRNALEGRTRKKADMEIFQKLKISYDYMKDATLQHCFLCCSSLVRENKRERFFEYTVGREELAEYLVDEGIIKRMNSRRKELEKAHTVLNFLGDVGLLEIPNDSYVSMNALIRSMALQIMEENNQQVMIGNCMSLKDLPDEKSWTEDLVRVSLQGNEIENIPSTYSPSCSKLSMLLLSRNCKLGYIGDSFFEGMPGLKILDLSSTGIESLPSSMYRLVNLTTLLLRWCRKLRRIGSVGELSALKKLDLFSTPVEEVEDIEKLSELTYLDLFLTHVKLEPQILAQLSHLQFLRHPWQFTVKGGTLECLSRLETLSCSFDDVAELNRYLLHLKGGFKEREAPRKLDVRVGPGPIYRSGFVREDLFCDSSVEEYEDFTELALNNCNIDEADMLICFQQIAIVECDEARSLCNFSPIKGATELKYISIRTCPGLELLCSVSLPGQGILENLKYMELSKLKNLSVLFRKVGNAAYGSCFSNLTWFLIQGCPSIKQLFPIHLWPNLKNLKQLYVLDCLSMEVIFAAEEEEEKEEESSMAEKGKSCVLPKLSILRLVDLPELERVCSRGTSCSMRGSIKIEIKNCPKIMPRRQESL